MAKNERSSFKTEVSKGRLEFLFDGVFAIALTILVLELKLPELREKNSVAELARALKSHGWSFFSYILSFMILIGFWISHNRIYARMRRISSAALAIHVGLLVTAVLIPFCAHLYGTYTNNTLAGLVYFGTIVFIYLELLALVIVADRQKLFDPDIPGRDIRRLRLSFLIAAAFLGAAYVVIYLLRLFD